MIFLILIFVAVFWIIKPTAKTLLRFYVFVFFVGFSLDISVESKIWICGFSGCFSVALLGAFLLEKRQKEKKELNTYREKREIERLMNELELREFERESHIRAREVRSTP